MVTRNNLIGACDYIVGYLQQGCLTEISSRAAYDLALSAGYVRRPNANSYRNLLTAMSMHPALRRIRYGYYGLSGKRCRRGLGTTCPTSSGLTLVRKDKLKALKEEVREGRRATQRLGRLERWLRRNFPQS